MSSSLRSRLLQAQILFTIRAAAAYNLTRYHEPFIRLLTADHRDPPEIVSYTSSVEITLTGTAVPSIITAVTSTDSMITVVDAQVPTGFGERISWDRYDPPEIDYYVEVVLTKCIESSRRWLDPITVTQSVLLPREMTGYMSPSTVIGKTAILAQSDVDPMDLADASYEAYPGYPTECSRVVSEVDYRSLCSTWIQTTTKAPSPTSAKSATTTSPPSRDDISCGQLNPCCHGCHGWGHAGPGLLVYAADAYICEDGRYLHLNGSEINMDGYWSAMEMLAQEATATRSEAPPSRTEEGDQEGAANVRSRSMAVSYMAALVAICLFF
ncbi:hypothetical protein HJFPF1_05682 [Paramyrothecium foliicola]|nr:hypothetical protein HJFPF1_05682 [Paramyrothecium foliicola]